MEVALLLILSVVIYFLPAIVAQSRHHTSSNGICVLNLFLGWTILGWIIALVWAFSGNPEAERLQQELARRQLAVLPQSEAEAVSPKHSKFYNWLRSG